MATRPPTRRRGLFWTAVVVALAVFVGGAVTAYHQYEKTAGPGGAVKGYFAALERSDASAALGFGDVPAGSRLLLTRAVLREQQRIAPISALHVTSVLRSGGTATVSVRYNLGFAGGVRLVTDRVAVTHRGRSWRLVRAAVPTELHLVQAMDRATIGGGAVPSGPVLLFPGAVPISFDTPYLQLATSSAVIGLSAAADTELTVQPTIQARTDLTAALTSALRSCLSGRATVDPRCPLPSDRAVPGSLRGTFPAATTSHLSLGVSDDPDGLIEVDSVTIRVTGRYTTLDFNNQRVVKTGTISLPITASTYATAPMTIDWGGDQ